MVLMDSLSDEEEFNDSNDSTKSGNYASHTSDSSSIILHPFAHQVGGHTQLLTFDKSTLCKPLIPRELLFYLNVPKELVNFVPSYKGVVQIRETGQGTCPPVVYQPIRSPKSPYAKYRPHHGTSMLHAGYHSEDDDDSSQQSVTDTCGFPFELKVQIRPFLDEKVLKKNLSQDNLLRADYISRPNERYLLLLENVASKYQLPCILDLKMGTRQHGDDATEEKRHRQIAKCQASTSASLGVRLCGMQVYQVDYGGFLWYDKYYGRKMDKGGLKRALHEYFRNGSQLNEDIIDDVINRLKLLSNAVEKSPSFRFYGTSLLIIHEGCASINKKCPVEVRLIDFAHTICDYTSTQSGRSSSSPSVLTKSSSAEQLSTTLPNNNTTTTTTTTITTKTMMTKPTVPRDPLLTAAVAAANTATPTSLPPQHPTAASIQQDDVDLNSNLSSLQTPTHVNVVTGQQQQQPCMEGAHDERENLFPSSCEVVAPSLGVDDSSGGSRMATATSSESNNNRNSSSINPNGSIDNIATSLRNKTSTSTTKLSKHNHLSHHHYHHHQKLTSYQNTLETLREVDNHHQQHTAQQPPELAEQPAHTTTTPTLTTTTTTTEANNRQQIGSTPTPPTLGGRKISKTSMGPDKGLLFGLENLMRLLDDLKSETLITTC